MLPITLSDVEMHFSDCRHVKCSVKTCLQLWTTLRCTAC